MIKKLRQFSLSNKETKQWFFIFLSLCLCFLPLLFHFIWGNHDWNPIFYTNKLTGGLVEGRFSQFLFLRILLEGQILPILNLLLGFAAYALALVLLYNRYFKFSYTPSTILLLITSATLPYIIEIIYFQFIVLSQLIWPLIITISLLLAKQATINNSHRIYCILLSSALLLLAIGGYPASVNLFVTAFCLYLLKQKDLSIFSKHFITICLPYLIALCIAFLSLCMIYKWLSANELMVDLYNNQPSSPLQIIKKLLPTIKISLMSFLQPLPFFNLHLKLTISFILILFICHELTLKKNIALKINCFILILALLLAIKTSALLSQQSPDNYFEKYDPIAFMLRTDFFAIPCLVMFCFSVLRESKSKLISNISFLLLLLLLWQSILTNYNFSKVHLFGFVAENKLQQRINTRIQEQSSYSPKHIYTLIQAGELPHRPKYYQPTLLEKYGYYTLNVPYTRSWIADEYYNFYEPITFVGSTSPISLTDFTPDMTDFFSHKITTWPHQNALYIGKKFIIIALTPQGRKMLIQQFNQTRKIQP